MQIIRTIVWVLLTALVVTFVLVNWGESHDVRIWPAAGELWYVLDLPVGVIALLFTAVGFVPMWLYHRASKWGMQRKIASLENAARTAATTPVVPAATPATEPAAPPPPSTPAPAPEPEPELAPGEQSELGPLTPPDEDTDKA